MSPECRPCKSTAATMAHLGDRRPRSSGGEGSPRGPLGHGLGQAHHRRACDRGSHVGRMPQRLPEATLAAAAPQQAGRQHAHNAVNLCSSSRYRQRLFTWARPSYAVRRMMCTPLSVNTGWLSSPTARAKVACSKGACICPRLHRMRTAGGGGDWEWGRPTHE